MERQEVPWQSPVPRMAHRSVKSTIPTSEGHTFPAPANQGSASWARAIPIPVPVCGDCCPHCSLCCQPCARVSDQRPHTLLLPMAPLLSTSTQP